MERTNVDQALQTFELKAKEKLNQRNVKIIRVYRLDDGLGIDEEEEEYIIILNKQFNLALKG